MQTSPRVKNFLHIRLIVLLLYVFFLSLQYLLRLSSPCALALFYDEVSSAVASSPVRKLLGNFSATLGSFSNFQHLEQHSVHRATFQFLCLYSHSHAPATSETINKCRI